MRVNKIENIPKIDIKLGDRNDQNKKQNSSNRQKSKFEQELEKSKKLLKEIRK